MPGSLLLDEIAKLREFFKPRNRAVCKWRSRAMLVDLHKTKITFIVRRRPKCMPPWALEAQDKDEVTH